MATPLLSLLRVMSKDQREAFASAVGTTTHYLYQLAAQPRPNPTLRMAMRLCTESQRMAKRLGCEPLTFDDLLVGSGDDDAPAPRPKR
jgi:hypothetical protein